MRCVLASVACCAAVAGQALVSATSTLDESGNVIYRASFEFGARPVAEPPVTGAPYSADEVSEATVIQQGGGREQQSQWLGRTYRDSAGRIRTEKPLPMGPEIVNPPRIVEISDCVAGFHYVLDAGAGIAHRFPLARQTEGREEGPRDESAGPPAAMLNADGTVATNGNTPAARPSRTEPVVANRARGSREPGGPEVEKLGIRPIDGLTAAGTRYTNAIPSSDPAESGLRVTTAETWESTELHVVLLSKFSDPRTGERTVRLTNLVRSEPDPALFRVPAGYRILDEKGEFFVTVTVPK